MQEKAWEKDYPRGMPVYSLVKSETTEATQAALFAEAAKRQDQNPHAGTETEVIDLCSDEEVPKKKVNQKENATDGNSTGVA